MKDTNEEARDTYVFDLHGLWVSHNKFAEQRFKSGTVINKLLCKLICSHDSRHVVC